MNRRWIVVGFITAVVLLGGTVYSLYSLRIGRASTANQQSCVPTSALPEGLSSLAASSDCVTGFAVLKGGTAVAGTIQGNLALATAGGGIRTLSSGGSGPVTSLSAFPTSPDRSRELVMYAVDEGIGVFNPQTANNLSLGVNHPLVDTAGKPIGDPSVFVADNRFFVMQPVKGRPRLNSMGQYALTKPDGRDEVVMFDFGVAGDLCFIYIPSPGFVPQRVCNDVSDQLSVPAAPVPSPVSTTPALPSTGGGCSAATDVTADPAHTINVVIGRNSIQPSAVTMQAGERYVVTLTALDSRVLHTLLLTDGTGQVVRDGNDSLVCLTSSASTSMIAPNQGGVVYLMDGIHPNLRVKVTVKLPSNPAPTLAPDVAALTPSVSSTQAQPLAPVQTPVPKTATPAP